jgi:hypothetical protein
MSARSTSVPRASKLNPSVRRYFLLQKWINYFFATNLLKMQAKVTYVETIIDHDGYCTDSECQKTTRKHITKLLLPKDTLLSDIYKAAVTALKHNNFRLNKFDEPIDFTDISEKEFTFRNTENKGKSNQSGFCKSMKDSHKTRIIVESVLLQ